jgi:transposase
VTHNGIARKDQITGIRSDYEYGNIALLHGIAEKTVIPVLKEIYPTMWERIISYVILRNIQPLPMKSIHYLYKKTYLSRIMDQSIRVMRKLTEKGEYVLMDSTAIFSRSENMSFLELGHNSKGMHLPQINVMMLFSATRTMPTFVRILPGSIGDVSALSETIDMAGVENCIIVADKGFFSSDNIKRLKSKHLSYIIPPRRNSSLVPEPDHFIGVFLYDGKPVKYWKRQDGVYVFEDPVLRSEEEKNFLLRIEENKRSKQQFDEN